MASNLTRPRPDPCYGRRSRFQATTTTPSPTSRTICQIQRASRRRDGRGRVEGVPQVEGEGQQGRAEEARDLHRPDRRRTDGDGRRVGQRRQDRVAHGRDAQGRRPVAEQEGDRPPSATARASRSPSGSGPPAAPSVPGWARPPGTVAATPTKARNATSRVVTRTAVRPVSSRPSRDGQDARLEGQAAGHDEPGQEQRRREPQAERHEADGADAGDRGDGRQDERLDGHAAAVAGRSGPSRRRGPGGCRGASPRAGRWPRTRRSAARPAATGRRPSPRRGPGRAGPAGRAGVASRPRSRGALLTRGRLTRSGLPATHASRSARDRVLSTSSGGRPTPAAPG